MLEDAIKELSQYSDADKVMSDEEFKNAHKRIQDITAKVKAIIGSLKDEQLKKYEKKAERKQNKYALTNRERL